MADDQQNDILNDGIIQTRNIKHKLLAELYPDRWEQFINKEDKIFEAWEAQNAERRKLTEKSDLLQSEKDADYRPADEIFYAMSDQFNKSFSAAPKDLDDPREKIITNMALKIRAARNARVEVKIVDGLFAVGDNDIKAGREKSIIKDSRQYLLQIMKGKNPKFKIDAEIWNALTDFAKRTYFSQAEVEQAAGIAGASPDDKKQISNSEQAETTDTNPPASQDSKTGIIAKFKENTRSLRRVGVAMASIAAVAGITVFGMNIRKSGPDKDVKPNGMNLIMPTPDDEAERSAAPVDPVEEPSEDLSKINKTLRHPRHTISFNEAFKASYKKRGQAKFKLTQNGPEYLSLQNDDWEAVLSKMGLAMELPQLTPDMTPSRIKAVMKERSDMAADRIKAAQKTPALSLEDAILAVKADKHAAATQPATQTDSVATAMSADSAASTKPAAEIKADSVSRSVADTQFLPRATHNQFTFDQSRIDHQKMLPSLSQRFIDAGYQAFYTSHLDEKSVAIKNVDVLKNSPAWMDDVRKGEGVLTYTDGKTTTTVEKGIYNVTLVMPVADTPAGYQAAMENYRKPVEKILLEMQAKGQNKLAFYGMQDDPILVGTVLAVCRDMGMTAQLPTLVGADRKIEAELAIIKQDHEYRLAAARQAEQTRKLSDKARASATEITGFSGVYPTPGVKTIPMMK